MRLGKHWVKVNNPKAPAVKREAEEDWGRDTRRSRHPMAIRLTRNQIRLLKELTAAGEHGQTIVALASSIEVAHLIGAQYIERLPRTKLYVITERGREALGSVAD
jgi:hypothetical protein